jgi:hypothetical protein
MPSIRTPDVEIKSGYLRLEGLLVTLPRPPKLNRVFQIMIGIIVGIMLTDANKNIRRAICNWLPLKPDGEHTM